MQIYRIFLSIWTEPISHLRFGLQIICLEEKKYSSLARELDNGI